jgi:hypothetical protein
MSKNNVDLNDLPAPSDLVSADHLPSPAELAGASASPETPGYLETLAHHVPQGLSFGLSDELKGALSSPVGAFHTMRELVGAKVAPEDTAEYKKVRDAERAALAATQEANPITAIAGQIAGGLLPGGLVAKGVGALAGAPLTGVQTALRAGAAEGALYGTGQSDAETGTGLATGAATGGVLGGAIGGTVGKLGKFLGGNAADVASGASQNLEKGALQDLGESKLGSRLKGFFQAGKEGVDTSSEAAEAARGVANKEEAGKILDIAQKKSMEVGKEIGDRVKAAGPMKPSALEELMPQLPQKVQEEVVQVLPGRINKISNAPKVLQDELSSVEKNIQQIIETNPDQTVKNFQKVSTEMVDPNILAGELEYNQLAQAQSNRIKQALQENPQQTLSDLYNNIVNKEAPSPELDDLFQQLKYKSAVSKLAKEAQVNTGMVPPEIQSLQQLLDKKSALKKAVSQFGKVEVAEPDQIVKEVVSRLDASHIAESDKAPAGKLKDIISKYVKPDGTVDPEKSVEFRNSLNHFTKSTDSYEIGNLARKLNTEIGAFRREAAGDLSGQFHDMKSFADLLKIDTAGMTENEIKNEIAPRFAKYLEKSESTASMDSGRMQDLVDKFVEATGNDPEIANSLNKIAQNAKYSELHKVKSGSTGSMFNDGVNRLMFAFPLETAGQVASNPLLQKVASTTATSGDKLLNLPAAAWRTVGAKVSTSSPTLSKLANQMADATDAGKKRAILNILNQMPLFRKSIESLAGVEEK